MPRRARGRVDKAVGFRVANDLLLDGIILDLSTHADSDVSQVQHGGAAVRRLGIAASLPARLPVPYTHLPLPTNLRVRARVLSVTLTQNLPTPLISTN